MESKDIILELCNWASTCLSNIHYSCGLVWFDCWDANCKPNRTAQFNTKVIRIHPNQLRFFAVSIWIGSVYVFLLGWLGFSFLVKSSALVLALIFPFACSYFSIVSACIMHFLWPCFNSIFIALILRFINKIYVFLNGNKIYNFKWKYA